MAGLRAAVWREGFGLKALWDLLTERGVDPAAGGWNFLAEARAISGDGRFIVGYGHRNGNSEAFLADLAVRLEFTRQGDSLRLAWPAGFKLQRTATLTPAAWADVPEAVPRREIPLDGQPGFFRVVSAP